MPLSLLLNDTAALLNDPTFAFNSKTQMVRWVNQARRDVAMRTGCIRRLITGQSAFGGSSQPGFFTPGAAQPSSAPDPSSVTPLSSFNANYSVTNFGLPSGVLPSSLQTIPGVERYPYVGFVNPVAQQQHAGISGVIDVIELASNWGGVSRPALDWLPWDEFQAYCRAYAVLNTAYPSLWSVMNDGPMGELYVFPAPSQAGDMEIDATCLPSDLNSNDDFDAIPIGFQDAIPFGAAGLCFLGTQRQSQGQVMYGQFLDKLGVSRVGSDRGKSRSYYI